MPRTGNSGYDTATNTFRALPLPLAKNRKPRENFAGPTKPAKPYVPVPRPPKTGLPPSGQAVQFPEGVSNGKY